MGGAKKSSFDMPLRPTGLDSPDALMNSDEEADSKLPRSKSRRLTHSIMAEDEPLEDEENFDYEGNLGGSGYSKKLEKKIRTKKLKQSRKSKQVVSMGGSEVIIPKIKVIDKKVQSRKSIFKSRKANQDL
jgi:hypothetical protein